MMMMQLRGSRAWEVSRMLMFLSHVVELAEVVGVWRSVEEQQQEEQLLGQLQEQLCSRVEELKI